MGALAEEVQGDFPGSS